MSTFEIIILILIYLFCYSYLCGHLIDKEYTAFKPIILLLFAPLAIVDIAINLYIKLHK